MWSKRLKKPFFILARLKWILVDVGLKAENHLNAFSTVFNPAVTDSLICLCLYFCVFESYKVVSTQHDQFSALSPSRSWNSKSRNKEKRLKKKSNPVSVSVCVIPPVITVCVIRLMSGHDMKNIRSIWIIIQNDRSSFLHRFPWRSDMRKYLLCVCFVLLSLWR